MPKSVEISDEKKVTIESGETLSEKSTLKLHEKSHTVQNQSYSCKYCDLKFATIIKAKIHQRCHKDDETYSSNSQEMNKVYENMKKPNVALDSSKSLENEFKTFKLPKNHGIYVKIKPNSS